LAEYAEDPEVKSVLNFLYNPYIVSGVSDKKLAKQTKLENSLFTLISGADEEITFLGLLEYFKNHNSGRDADVLHLVRAAGALGERELVYSVVKKDLKLGIQDKTLNKVYGEGFIPAFDLMLAERYADNAEYIAGKRFILTEKLDGVRSVLVFQGDTPVFYSRQGKSIEGFIELGPQVMNLPKDYVYDGEMLLLNTEKLPSKDLYRATVKITSNDSEKRGIIFNIFDMVKKDEFMAGAGTVPAEERKTLLHKTIAGLSDCPNIREVEMLYVGADTGKIPVFLQKMIDQNKEGLMINTADGIYECKRTKNLLKVKQFNTADVLVLGLEEGSGQNKGKLGAVLVKFIAPDGTEQTCRVGSGFKQDERERFWADKDAISGKIIEIGYFEITRNQKNTDYSLRFPTFKGVRTDKEEISMF
jgi:DNA ligase-1